MYGIQNAAHPVVGALFFVVLVIFGSFFALNLLLAVLANSFEETKGQELKDIEEEVARHFCLSSLNQSAAYFWCHCPVVVPLMIVVVYLWQDLQTVYEMEVIKHAVSYRGVLYDQLQAVLRDPR